MSKNKYITLLSGTAVAALSLAVPQAPVHAQAQPVVDVCTGLSLNESELTDLLGAVNGGIVSPIETTVNDLLGVLTILGLPAPLNVDVTGIVGSAVAGNPVSVDVLTSDGTVAGPGECNVAVDGLTLNDPAGLSIGGNQITGLGTGLAASAGTADSIALGDGANTDAGAGGAVALGTGASVTADNSVALGSGSIADRADSVSVGAVGDERQITNVAAGTADTDAATVGQMNTSIAAATADSVVYDTAAHDTVTFDGTGGTTLTNVAPGALSATSTDAVNGAQLFATNQDVAANTADITTIDTRVTVNEGAITALQDTAVAYDDATQTSITLGGAGGTTISNVADGTLSATSTDAVNGSQLFATNQAVTALDGRVTQNETDIAQNRTDIDNLQTSVGQIQVSVDQFDDRITQNETDIANLDGRVTVNETDIANLDGRVTVNETDIANLDGRVTVNEGDIANLDGRVTVNEGDIANLDDRVTVNEGDIVSLDNRVTVNETDIAQVQAQIANIPVGYVSDADGTTPSTTPTDTAAFVGASGGPVQVTNVAAATLSAGSTDAVNGSQLYATNQAVQQNTDDIQTINNNLAGSTIVAVQYSDPDNPTVSNGGTITNDVTLIGRDATAPVALHNVADATAATDAVNLRQMEAGLANVLADSMGYTDMRIAQIGFDLAELRDDAFSGTASAMAMASIPQAVEPGKMMVGGGVGHYRSETSFGFGLSSAFADGKAVLKVSGTIGANGKGGVAAGAGFSF